jgi:hypothetical protein
VNYLGGRIPEAVLLKANGLPHLGGGRNEPGRSTRP